MHHTTPTTIIVMHADHVAALCTRDRVFFAEGVQAMPVGHLDRRYVAAKCLIAGEILNGTIPGPYIDADVDRAARLILNADS